MKNNWWLSELGIPTKGALVEKIRSIVARTVRIVATDDTEFMRKVFSHHYEWIDKQGCGVHHLEVRNNGTTRGFWIVRIDGSAIDISWVVALRDNGRPSDKDNAVLRQTHAKCNLSRGRRS